MRRVSRFGFCLAGVVASVCLGISVHAADSRGLFDSSVSTLAGGNTGDGATDGKTVPLPNLNGGIARDSTGALYYSEGNRILKQVGAGVTVYAGSLINGYDGENIPANQAILDTPTYMCTDASDNLYFVDSNNKIIRKITKAGIITTAAGNRNAAAGIADIGRTATDARLPGGIVGIAANAGGDIFFISNVTFCIYKVTAADGLLSIIAGNGTGGAIKNADPAVGNPIGGVPQGLALLGDGSVIYSESTFGTIRNVGRADGNNVVIAGVVDTTPATLNNVLGPITTLYPDDNTKKALQNTSATVTAAMVGGCAPRQVAVDGTTVVFIDAQDGRIRSFVPGANIQTIFGEKGEGSNGFGFFGDNSPAAVNTPRGGVIITAGPNGLIDSVIGGDDEISDGSGDRLSRPLHVFAGFNNKAETTAAGDDVQVVPLNTTVNDDRTKRNDDPRANINAGALVSAGNVVTFIDDGNGLVRQATVGANVNTLAGSSLGHRVNNIGLTRFGLNLTNTQPIPALGAPIGLPNALAQDTSGNLYFDAVDQLPGGLRGIYKYDAAAKTVVLIGGRGYTNGVQTLAGDGGPAATAPLSSLGAQATVLANNATLFADPLNHVIRMVDAAGVLTTVAGIAGVSGNSNPDGDSNFKNEVIKTGSTTSTVTIPQLFRVGKKPTEVLFSGPQGVLATSATDFFIADTGNSRIVQVAGGVITHDFGFNPTDPLTQTPVAVRFLALSKDGKTLFAASTTTVFRIDLTTAQVDPKPTALAVTSRASGNTIGFGLATIGTPATDVVIIMTNTGNVRVWQQAVLANNYFAAPGTFTPSGASAVGGMFVGPSDVFFTNTANDDIRKVPLSAFGNPGSVPPVAPASDSTLLAGKFSNVVVNGFKLQSNFEFTTTTPLGLFADGTILVGDDGVTQFRRVTVVGTKGDSTTTVFAGTGSENNGGVDGGPALAANIGPVGGIAVDSTGAVFFSDGGTNTVRKIAASIISTVAGIANHVTGTYSDGGDALKTTLNNPLGLAFLPDGTGDLHIADNNSDVVRKLSGGKLVTVAGAGTDAGNAGDQFDPLKARLFGPNALTFDKNGDLYIGTQSHNIRVVGKNNIISTLCGNKQGTTPTYSPQPADQVQVAVAGIAVDAGGKVFNTDGLSWITRTADDEVIGVAGDIVAGFNGDGLPAARTLIQAPNGIVASTALGLVFCDTSNNRVRAITGLAEATSSKPTAVIHASQFVGVIPLKVAFDGSASFDADGDIRIYEWDFGDGTKGFGPQVEHIYTKVGNYNVKLTVTDSQANTNTTQAVVAAASPIIQSNTTGKGSIKVSFSQKSSKPSDSLSLTITNLAGLINEPDGTPVTVSVGEFVISGKIGKSNTNKSLSVKTTVDSSGKKPSSISASIKGVVLKDALAKLGFVNHSTINGKAGGGELVSIPIVIQFGDPAKPDPKVDAIFGDIFPFRMTAKFNSGASGSFSQ